MAVLVKTPQMPPLRDLLQPPATAEQLAAAATRHEALVQTAGETIVTTRA